MNQRNFPFRRNLTVSPIMVPATDEPSYIEVELTAASGVTSFAAINSFPIYIRLVGTPASAEPNLAGEGVGWLFPPGHFGIYSSQYPRGLSAVAVERPGFPIYDGNGELLYPEANLELAYGGGA